MTCGNPTIGKIAIVEIKNPSPAGTGKGFMQHTY
nr:MAG TPA: hypothetical protein [Caudoviricetes sp.]